MEKPNPYNPLAKRNLGVSVADALIAAPVHALPPEKAFIGAGVYAIYYAGAFPTYKTISMRNRGEKFEAPIYVGKAVPAGARKGGLGLDVPGGTVLHNRLKEHGDTIKVAPNLKLSYFFCRFLVVDDIWIPLGESLLIERFKPVWNWPARCFIPVRMRVYITGNRSASDLDGGGSARLSAVGAGGR